jgi:hypothetical protein
MNVNVCAFCRPTLQVLWSVVVPLAFLLSPAFAADPMIITSATKQFVVRGLPQRSMLSASPNSDLVYVDPPLLAVTCEKVKSALQRELGWGERWRGTVFINVHPIGQEREPIRIHVSRAEASWRYHLSVPDEVSRRDLIEAIVEVLLAEFADRAAVQQSVELPPWLVEGLTAHLMQGPLAGAALQARTLDEITQTPGALAARTTRHADVDQSLRLTLQQEGALTFDQLNWPDFDEGDKAKAAAYHHSAHLFIRELLRLRGGPDALCAMLAMLPEHLNWQTAFLRAFEPHFHRLLEVEKWWSLSLTQLKTRDSSLLWSRAEARQKLEDILYTPMQVKLRGESRPHTTPVALQTVISDWDFPQQVPLLRAKLFQLQTARMRLPGELAAVSDSYRAALENYLRVRGAAWFGMTARAAAARAVAELNQLDQQRERILVPILPAKAPETAGGPVP